MTTEAAQASAQVRRRGLAICLSGGGYRAALFHLGALRRLDELGILGTARTISGVSGGAIVGMLLSDRRLVWPGEVATQPDSGAAHAQRGRSAAYPQRRVGGFEDLVATPLRSLAAHNVRTPALLSKLRPDRWFVRDAGVRGLAAGFIGQVPWWSTDLRDNGTDGPAVVVGATELGYGVDWVFMDPNAARPCGRVGDCRVGYAVPPAGLRLADAVAASCALPPYFAPMRLDGRQLDLVGGIAGRESTEVRAAIIADLQLADGGVYDNLGLEPVWRDHAAILVSDGGGVFRANTEYTVLGRLLKTLSIATSGGGAVRVRWLLSRIGRGALDGAVWALDSVEPHGYPPHVADVINAIRTDLDRFSVDEQKILERHGYLVTDHVVRTHAPRLVVVDAPLRPPHPEVADPAYALKALRGSRNRTLLGRF